MDQQEPRENFVKNLYSFCEEVELNDAFIEALKQHSNAKYIEEVMVRSQFHQISIFLLFISFVKIFN
jgi:hypothetical protein